jgi:hypothetical protein
MARYYFDTHDDGTVLPEDVGLDCADLAAVRDQAAMSLAELARDVLPGSLRRVLSVKVHDGQHPVLEAPLIFEAVILKQ